MHAEMPSQELVKIVYESGIELKGSWLDGICKL